jgi:hypothetical protein
MGSSIKFLIQPQGRGAAERALASFAKILGVGIAEVVFPDRLAVGDSFISELVEGAALISSAEALAALFSRNPGGLASLDSLVSHLRFLLIYGLERCPSELARTLLASNLIAEGPSFARSPLHRYHLSPAGSAFSLQLAGISFEVEGSRGPTSSPAVTHIIGDATTPIIDCDGAPFFAALRRRGCELFLLESSELVDPDTPAPMGEFPLQAYPALLPWLIFLRRAAGGRCWHNPAPRACLIIDDPPLRPRYGFLSFTALVESMRRSDFKTTIAFIPWNYSRSAFSTTDLFRRNDSMLSLCIHGCDHTAAEFGAADLDVLRQKAHTALERMRLHQCATQLKWDRVMVFPQGTFSSTSLVALEREGYLAAVNSGLSSVDRPEINRVADLLVPASKSYGGVPLFKRQYPRGLLPFALDLFLGKQVLIVEHHTYFRAGYDRAAVFAAQLKAIEPRLSWSSLGNVLRSAVQYRVTASGNELRAYTDEVLVTPPEPESRHYKLIKHETDPGSVSGVLVNGSPVEYRLAADRVEVEFDARDECRVDVLRRPAQPTKTGVTSLSYRARVAARRYLSEFRDNARAGNAWWPVITAHNIGPARGTAKSADGCRVPVKNGAEL